MTQTPDEQTREGLIIKGRQDALTREMGLSPDALNTTFGVDKSTPYLLNIAEAPALAGCLLYYLPKGKPVTIGADRNNRISLSGIGISDNLCKITNEENSVLRVEKC